MPTHDELRIGAETLLSVIELFPKASVGCDLPADLLTGLWCQELRTEAPDFCPVTIVPLSSPKIKEILSLLVSITVTRQRWQEKKFHIHRQCALDYRTHPGQSPRYIQDFSQLKCKVSGLKPFRIPAMYNDTVVLIIGAGSDQLREAAPYLENSAVFLLGYNGYDQGTRRISKSDLNAYDPNVLECIRNHRSLIAAVLSGWWAECSPEMAKSIVSAAQASIGKPDTRYVTLGINPKLLATAIRHQTLLALFNLLENSNTMSKTELAPFREQVQFVYAPTPTSPAIVRSVDDPEVFLEIMRELVTQKTITPLDEPHRKGDGHFGAWREISGVRYLVLDEMVWKAAYGKASRAKNNLNVSVLKEEHWERMLQKRFGEAGYIKFPSAGSRYRYDLYGSGKRDSTYVLCIPQQLLLEDACGQIPRQGHTPAGKGSCQEICPESAKKRNNSVQYMEGNFKNE